MIKFVDGADVSPVRKICLIYPLLIGCTYGICNALDQQQALEKASVSI